MIPAPPHTVAHELRRARKLLGEAGWEIAQVDETRPPDKYRRPAGPLRVIQQRPVEPGRVVLVVAHQVTLDL